MKNYFLSAFLCTFVISNTFSQTIFQKVYDGVNADVAHSVKSTNDGGYIVVGRTFVYSAANYQFHLIKTDVGGTIQWTQLYGGANNEIAYSVQQTGDGGYIVAGYSDTYGSGSHDIFVMKTDASGNITWNKTLGGVNLDDVNSIQQTSDGGYIMAGSTQSISAGSFDIYIIKLTSTGAVTWTKTYGGADGEEAYSIKQTSDGGYIVTGYTGNPSTFINDIFLLKIDASGTQQWFKTYGGTNDDFGKDVLQTSDGGYIVTGYGNSFGSGDYDVYLIKTNSLGNIQWDKNYGGINGDYAHAIKQATNGDFIIAGQTQSFGAGNFDAYILRTDTAGTLKWSKTYGTSAWEVANAIDAVWDNGIVFAGNYANPDDQFYLVKTDSLGNSGCTEMSATSLTTDPPTIIASPVITSSTGGTLSTPSIIPTTYGSETTLCLTLGENENKSLANELILFPNPVHNSVTLNTLKKIIMFNVFDNVGQCLMTSKNINASNTTIDVSQLTPGMYFVQVVIEGKIETQKLMKE